MAAMQTPTGTLADWRPTIAPVTAPSGVNSAQPQMTVSPRGILLSWIERAGSRATLKFAERTTTGWSAATTVAAGDDWFVNWADVPSVLRLRQRDTGGALAAEERIRDLRLRRAAGLLQGRGTDVVASHSRRITTARSASTGSDRCSRCQAPDSASIWLDGRAMGSAQGHDAHGASEGAMSVRFGTFDTAWKQTSEMPVDLRVCECCPTTAAMTSDGPDRRLSQPH